MLALAYYRTQFELASGRSERVRTALVDLASDYVDLINRIENPEEQMKSNLESVLLLHQQARRVMPGIPPIQPEFEPIIVSPNTSAGVLARALWLDEQNHPDTENALRLAIEMAERDQFPALIVDAVDVLVHLLIDQGRLEDAQKQLDLLLARNPEVMENDYTVALICLRVAAASGSESQWRRALRRVESLAGERPMPDQLAAVSP